METCVECLNIYAMRMCMRAKGTNVEIFFMLFYVNDFFTYTNCSFLVINSKNIKSYMVLLFVCDGA